MAKKRKTLPDNFYALLTEGDLDKLKQVFDTVEIDARKRTSKQTALHYKECSREFVEWLIAQGADLHAPDYGGNTPLHSVSDSRHGSNKDLLELGANIHARSNHGYTPLHSAALRYNTPNAARLLEYGAQIDAVNNRGNTPLEWAMRLCQNGDIEKAVELSKLFLGKGVPITPLLKKYVTSIGESFEFHRANFNKDYVDETSNALDELYKLYDVEPVPRRIMYDGTSPIKVKATTWQQQHAELWDLLVPSSGPTTTVQGEVIRVTGRIANELDGNGGINWDNDFKLMASAFIDYIQQGHPLSLADISEAEQIVKRIKQRSDDSPRMCELGVKWVLGNPLPLKLGKIGYDR